MHSCDTERSIGAEVAAQPALAPDRKVEHAAAAGTSTDAQSSLQVVGIPELQSSLASSQHTELMKVEHAVKSMRLSQVEQARLPVR